MSAQAVDGLTRGKLLADVRQALSASRQGERGLGFGVEVELIPVRSEDGAPLPVQREDGTDGPTGTELLAAVGNPRGWRPGLSPTGTPQLRAPGRGAFSFEPGGQIEFSTRTYASVDALLRELGSVVEPLFSAAQARGVRMVTRGLNPESPAEDARLCIDTERYRKQAAHYDARGPWGRSMMCQSAALHVNVDLGGRPVRRWWVANRVAPYLTAIFANSPRQGGSMTGHRSRRAHLWRNLDPTRTGTFVTDADPAGAYLRFALDAADFLTPDVGVVAQSFGRSLDAGADREAWKAHLTTLFPEVRPRGYLEIRSVDALRPAWYAAPLVLLAGVLYGPAALREAEALLPDAGPELLVTAGREGLRDAEILGTALQLFDLGLEGARDLSEEVVGPEALEVARTFRDRLTARGLDPGDEPDDLDPFEV